MRTAKAKSPPKPPPGSSKSIRRKTEELESATALLKEARPIIERLEGEIGLDQPQDPAAGNEPSAARSWEFATRDAFERACSRWLAVRAPQDTVEQDEEAAKVHADLAAAEREVVLMPALYGWMVWRKLEDLGPHHGRRSSQRRAS